MSLSKALKATVETKWRHSPNQERMHRQVVKIIDDIGNPGDVDQRTLDEAMIAIRRHWSTPSTAKRVANNLRSVVNVGQRYGILDQSLVLDMPRVQLRRRQPLTGQQIQHIKDTVRGTEHETPTLVLIHCGLRGFGKELQTFKMNHDDRTLTVKSMKGGVEQERRVPLPHHLYAMISSVGEGYTEDEVNAAADFWRKNFTGWKPYQLRHSYATRLLSKGAPVTLVQYLMGHSSIETTMTYTHITADDISSARDYA